VADCIYERRARQEFLAGHPSARSGRSGEVYACPFAIHEGDEGRWPASQPGRSETGW
jgi:hypothetical protein